MKITLFVCHFVLAILLASQSVAADLDLEYSGSTSWDAASGTLRFESSGEMPDAKESFHWKVPTEVKRIVIAANVTVTGGFRIGYRKDSAPLHIVGEDRDSSIIFGTDATAWTRKKQVNENDKWRYSSVSVVADAVVHIENLTSKNPRAYHISGYAKKSVIHVDRCALLDTRAGDDNNSDGFVGSSGSSIRRSLIRTSDDAIKCYNDLTIEDVTVEQGRNGAAIQCGWGGETGDVKVKVRNLTITGIDPDGRYNMAPFTWEKGTTGSRSFEIDGLTIRLSGKTYHEASKAWQDVGIFELKPSGCRFDLTAKGADVGGLGMGLRTTPGDVHIRK